MADKRWKSVERRCAAEMNRVLSDVGKFSPVERIPLLGREGPDLTVNETGLVINVKSRQAIPARMFPTAQRIHTIGELACFRLEDMGRLDDIPLTASTHLWKQLNDWHSLMDRWTKEFQPNGISAILIHRPRMPIGHTGIVIHINDLQRLTCQIKTRSNSASRRTVSSCPAAFVPSSKRCSRPLKPVSAKP